MSTLTAGPYWEEWKTQLSQRSGEDRLGAWCGDKASWRKHFKSAEFRACCYAQQPVSCWGCNQVRANDCCPSTVVMWKDNYSGEGSSTGQSGSDRGSPSCTRLVGVARNSLSDEALNPILWQAQTQYNLYYARYLKKYVRSDKEKLLSYYNR